MTSKTQAARQPRRMARPAEGEPKSVILKARSKLETVEAMLLRAEGVSIAELMAATGWQTHSVRGALAGAMKKRGLAITSDKVEGTRRYRASKEAA